MKTILWLCAVALACLVSVSVASMLAGCHPTKTAQKAAFMSESLECVEKAKTLDESRMCREGVKSRYLVLWGLDAGKDGAQ